MKSEGWRLAGCLVLTLTLHLLSGGERTRAQVRPIRFEPDLATVAVPPDDAQILDAHVQSQTAPFATTERELLSQSDLLPYCGDGDGCRVTLLLFREPSELPGGRGEWTFFLTPVGDFWTAFEGKAQVNGGNLTDGSLEVAFFVGGSDRCKVAEELTSIGNIERFFLVAISDPTTMPPGSLECRLRIED